MLEADGIVLLNGLAGGGIDLGNSIRMGSIAAPVTEGMKSRPELIRQIADENNFTIRQFINLVATARGHFTVVGSAEQVADTLQAWFENEAADGFNVLPPWLPGGLDDFIELVVPILQKRGLFHPI